VLIYLTQDAQIGIFKDTPIVKTELRSSTPFFKLGGSLRRSGIMVNYKNREIFIPYNSIAYWTYEH
jgi:hypothetical protein